MNTHGRDPPTQPSVYHSRVPLLGLRRAPQHPQPLKTHVDEYQYVRTQGDVNMARQMLSHLGLPIEIVLGILDDANYFTTLKAQRRESVMLGTEQSLNYEAAALYLTSPVISFGDKEKGVTHEPRFIKFNIESSDQGFCDDSSHRGTYKGSYTWFEASILRPVTDREPGNHLNEGPLEVEFPSKPLPKWKTPRYATDPFKAQGWKMLSDSDDKPIMWKVQSNITATREAREHEVLWINGAPGATKDANGQDNGKGDGVGFLDELQEGDRVALWARSEFQAWRNYVRKASIEVGYEEVYREKTK